MKILLLAGEESGMIYRGKIEAKIRAMRPDAEIRGYGDYGFKTGDLAVMGVIQVLKKIFYFLRVKRTMERAIDDWRPDVVCTIDYPGLNLKLAAYAKARGIRAVHVVCPQVWAWHQSRIPKIERDLDTICCFFPFEPKIFRPGLGVFVGHPLVEEMQRTEQRTVNSEQRTVNSEQRTVNSEQRTVNSEQRTVNSEQRTVNSEQRTDLDVSSCSAAHPEKDASAATSVHCSLFTLHSSVLALLPGSRVGEIRHHLPKMIETVNILKKEIPNLRAVIPAANEKARRAIAEVGGANPPFEVQDGGARELLRRADAAVVASGTATLEAGLARCPTVLVYHVDWLFEAICRITLKGVKHIGLVNIVCEKLGAPCPMPELIQQDFTVEKMLTYLRSWLTDPAANKIARETLDEAVGLLRTDGDAVEKIVATMLEGAKA